MSRRFVLTPSASRDIDAILEYVLEKSGPDRARHVHERLYEGIAKVATKPGLGHIRDDLFDESLRVFGVFSYLIIYLPATTPLQIIRVIHGARNVPRVLERVG